MDAVLYAMLKNKITETTYDDTEIRQELLKVAENATDMNSSIAQNTNNIEKKLDKNQGASNSGKITGINESGDIVPMFPQGVTYNEDTQCLEYGADEKLNLNAGIQLDDTLSKVGYAADAASVGELKGDLAIEITNRNSAINEEKSRAITRENEIEELFSMPTQEAVENWLDKHPEATTTVQNGSLDELKFTEEAKTKIVKDYVTPEMFGAKGNGTTDDTEALQNTINYAKTNNCFVKGNKTYFISNTILIDGFVQLSISIRSIKYSGTSCAVLITNCTKDDFTFGEIIAKTGSCIKYFSDSNRNNHVSYTNLKFDYLNAKDKCIAMEIGDTDGYVNENKITGGWLDGGNYGIYADAKSRTEIQFKTYNIGFEGVKTGIYLNGTSSCSFINPRYGEYADTPLLVANGAKYILWVGIDKFYAKRISLTSNVSGRVLAPISENYGGIVSYDGIFENGLIIPQNVLTSQYKNTLKTPLNLNDIENYLTTYITFFLVTTGTTEIKLNKLYGGKFGIKQFICFFNFENGTELTIYDADNNIIFNNTAGLGYSRCKFTYQAEVGWICEKMNYIKSVMTV